MTNAKNQTVTEVIDTPEGEIKVTRPKRHRGVAVVLDTDDVVRNQARGFTHFLQEYAVVGLALGFIVGQQANGVVKQFVASFLDPLTRVWFGQNLSTRTATLHHDQTAVQVPWGAFVFTLVEFFFVLIAMYAIIKLFKLDKFTKKP